MDKQRKTICWNCANTNGKKCSWFAKNAKPVDGWEAIRNDIAINDHGTMRFCESYIVTRCPNFYPSECYKRELEELEELKRIKAEREKAKTEKKPRVWYTSKHKKIMGNALKKCRQTHKMNQLQLADALYISSSMVCRYEQGTVQYEPENIRRVLPDINEYIAAETQDIVLGK